MWHRHIVLGVGDCIFALVSGFRVVVILGVDTQSLLIGCFWVSVALSGSQESVVAMGCLVGSASELLLDVVTGGPR